MNNKVVLLFFIWIFSTGFDKKESESKYCDPWLGYCFTNSCIMDFAQNNGYFVVWVDCGTSIYRYQDTGCIGPSIYDYCESPVTEIALE